MKKRRELEAQRQKLFTNLHEVAIGYTNYFQGIGIFHERFNQDFEAQLNNGAIPPFGLSRYHGEYPLEALQEWMGSKSFGLVDFDLYIALVNVAHGHVRLNNLEKRLTDISEKYVPVVNPDDPGSAQLAVEQRQLARVMLLYYQDRKSMAVDMKEMWNSIRLELEKLLKKER